MYGIGYVFLRNFCFYLIANTLKISLKRNLLMFEEKWGAEIKYILHLQFVEKQKLALNKSAQSLV